MHYVLVPYTGSGTDAEPFRPNLAGDFASVDLRPDITRAAGFAFVESPTPPAGAVESLGAATDAPVSAAARRRIGSMFGVTIDATTVRDLLGELVVTRLRLPVAIVRRGGRWVRQVVVGGLAWEQVIEGGPGAMLSESFNKADSTVLGPGQAWTEVVGDWQVKTNAAEAVGTGANMAVVSALLATGDHRAEATVSNITGSPGVLVRASDTAHSGYFAHIVAADGTRRLAKIVTGTFTVLASAAGTLPTLPVRFAAKVEGSSLSLLDDAGKVTAGPVTDTTFDGTIRRVGIRVFAAGARLDDFVGADLDTTRPTVTINQAVGQADPTTASPINFAVEFSEPVTGFAAGDVALSGTAGATTALVSGSGASYTVAVSGMTGAGSVVATIPANVAQDAAGNLNTASTSTDNTVTYQSVPPQPTILVAFDTDPLSATPVYTDVSDFGSELTITQGRQQELDAFQPGTVRGPLDNSDRRFDPRHAGSPYAGKLKPRKRVRIRTTRAGTVHDLAVGFVHGWPQGYQHPEMASTELAATDAFLLLASAELPGSVYEVEVRKDNPHAWWRLGETVGITALDSSGNGYDGVYVGGATFNTRQGLIFGDDDNGIEFDPARKQSVGILSADVTTYPLTVEFWMQVTAEQKPPDSARIWSQGDGRLARISLRSDGTLGALFGGVTAFTPAAYSDGQAHHVVVRATTTEVRIFVDGISRVSSTGAPGAMNDGPVFLAQSGTFPYFAGILDEVAMYRSALADSRISAHYVAGTKPWDGDTTGARVNKVLDLIGWPAAERDIDAGNSTLGPAQLRRAKALNYLQLIERTEQGALYMKPDNALRFRERRRRFYDARMTTPQWTLTDEDVVGALHYEGDLELTYDEDLIYNEVTVRWDGGEVTEIDEPSRTQYGPKGHPVDTIARTADDARWIAQWVLDHYRQPQDRVSSVTVNPGVDPLLWDVALASRVGDRVALRRHPQTIGDPFAIEAHVEGKEHVIGTDTWTTTLPLSVAGTKRYWILGTSALGVDTYLGY